METKFKKCAKELKHIPVLIPATNAIVMINYELGKINKLPNSIIELYK